MTSARFIKDERGPETEEILAALARIEADVADFKARSLPRPTCALPSATRT
jgi:hypothetical protein